MTVCRVCLCNKPRKDITELVDVERKCSFEDIMEFCLGIQITEESSITTKLCTKCFKKIIEFFQFKSLALKSNAYLCNLVSQIVCIKGTSHCVTCENNSQAQEISNLENDQTEETLEIKYLHDIENKPLNDIVIKEEIGSNPSNLKKEEDSSCPSPKYEFDKVSIEVKDEFNPVDWSEIEADSVSSINYAIEDSIKKELGKTKRIKSRPSKTKRRLYKKNYRDKKALEICPQCGKQVKDLKNHLVTHFSYEQRRKFKCDLCHKEYQTVQGKNKHMNTHTDNAKKQCSICKIEVLYLKQHMITAHQPEARRFPCTTCSQRFVSLAALNYHVSVHINNKPFQCDVCGHVCRTAHLLDSHKRRVHLKEKSYQCDFCSKSFFKKEKLREHIRIHTKEKPYKCPECGKAFISTCSLRNHRYIHSGETFNCTKCDMTFSRPKYLTTHLKTHSKVKRYPCQYCSVAFYRSDHRNRHETTAHSEKKVKSVKLQESS